MKDSLLITALGGVLLVAGLTTSAHVSPYAKRDFQPRNRVTNFRSVCSELHRLSLVLQGCGIFPPTSSDAEGEGRTHQGRAEPLTAVQMQRVCPMLCRNGLASETCECEELWKRGVNARLSVKMDYNMGDEVCDSLCSNGLRIDGCSCASDDTTSGEDGEGGGETTETTTEPDWNELCLSLCKQGDGGALCNCDKPPFFRK